MRLKLRSIPGLNVVDTFWSFAQQRESGCWEWTGPVSWIGGYGVIALGTKPDGLPRHEFAHRMAWMLHSSEAIRDEVEVCHKCDYKPCINPGHLFLGTHRDNMLDALAKGRWQPGSSPTKPRYQLDTALRGRTAIGLTASDLELLPRRERDVLARYLGVDCAPQSLSEIGAVHGISMQVAHRLKNRALRMISKEALAA